MPVRLILWDRNLLFPEPPIFRGPTSQAIDSNMDMMARRLSHWWVLLVRCLKKPTGVFDLRVVGAVIGGIVHHSATNRPSLRVRGFCLDGTCSMNFLERFICLTLAM